MKTKLLVLFFTLAIITLPTKAQSLTESEISGVWKVAKIHILNKIPQDQKQTLELVTKAFLKSKFNFKPDKNFSFDIEFNDIKIKNKYWKLDKLTQSFIVQDWKDKDTNKSKLMEIATRKDGNKILFMISETFLELEMLKE
jgi:hypothetical protein